MQNLESQGQDIIRQGPRRIGTECGVKKGKAETITIIYWKWVFKKTPENASQCQCLMIAVPGLIINGFLDNELCIKGSSFQFNIRCELMCPQSKLHQR